MIKPVFDPNTNKLDLPFVQGVQYTLNDVPVPAGRYPVQSHLKVKASPVPPATFRPETETYWEFEPSTPTELNEENEEQDEE